MRILIKLITILLAPLCMSAQNVGIGHWETHLAYVNGLSVAAGNGKVLCATQSGIYFYNTSDNSLEKLSKINGLSDAEPAAVGYNPYNNKFIIAYKNTNVDIIENSSISNLADIKRKTIMGDKSINNIYFINQYAYLACGFGIVVVDMDKKEIKDTYYLGNNGKNLNIKDVCSDQNFLYAATDTGIYKASITNTNLADFANWSFVTGLPNGVYNSIASFNNNIVTNFSKYTKDGTKEADTLFIFKNNQWQHFPVASGYVVHSLKSYTNKLIVTYDSAVTVFDTSFVATTHITGYMGELIKAKQAVIDQSNTLWIADNFFGLVSAKAGNQFIRHQPNGPDSPNVNDICIADNKLLVAPGGGGGTFYNGGIYSYNGDEWKRIYGNHPPIVNFDSIYDIMNVVIDPNNSDRAFANWGSGLIELAIESRNPVKIFNESNSTLRKIYNSTKNDPIWVHGLAFDKDGSLWIANSLVPTCLNTLSSKGQWQSYNFSGLLNENPQLGDIIIDQNNQKWVILIRNGIFVFSGNAAPGVSNTKKLTTETGMGALPSLNITAIAEDKEGQIWIGSDKGIAVIYNPSAVFSGQSIDAQQILIEQDGNIQLLLETETVQSIAIDGANRKWIATKNSGVFLMSADGTKEIYHFTESNSSLFSNDVKKIAINHKTGEVYFGTAKGIIAFRGTATEGGDDFADVYAFPNPVKPEYAGPIAIKGLMQNSTVKITDISGNLVFETKSEGGQAIWNGKNANGEKVKTGVYMVFCTSEDGSKKIATKIVFIN